MMIRSLLAPSAVLAAALLALAVVLLRSTGTELVPQLEQGRFEVELEAAPGTPLEQTDRLGGDPLALPSRRDRRAEVAVFRLRANRAPFLRSTLALWGREPSAICQRCRAGVAETTEHFILDCTAHRAARDEHGVSGLDILNDVERCAAFLREAGVL